MADRVPLTDDLVADVVRSRSIPPPPWLLGEIVRAAEATPQARGWFRPVMVQPWRRIVLIAAIAMLLAAAGAAIGGQLLRPEPGPLLDANGEIMAADENGTLIAIDPETGRSEPVAFCSECRLPSWSADGSMLAYVTGRTIRVRDMASGTERDVATCVRVCDALSLGSDGSRIAYASGGAAILHDLDGDAADRRFTPSRAIDVDLSPDGLSLLIGGRSSTLHLIDLETADAELLVDDPSSSLEGPLYAAWSPDGSRIAFTIETPSEPDPTSGVPWEYQLWVMNADGGDRQLIWTRPGCCMRFWAGTSWSPDGKQLTAVLGGPSSVWIVNADGTGAHALTGVSSERVAWRPRP